MAPTYPYMPSVKNLDDILAQIKVAQTPPKFTHEFLKSHLGFASSNDRSIVKVLKKLGFLKADGTPTDRYNQFRAEQDDSVAMAKGLEEGWSEVFLSHKDAHKLSPSEAKEILKNLTGKSDSVSEKMATTFNALTKHADFDALRSDEETVEEQPEEVEEQAADSTAGRVPAAPQREGVSLHNDIHIHLPPSSDVAVYTAIFRALREELLD